MFEVRPVIAEPTYLTVAQTAETLGVSTDFIRSLISRGDLAAVKLPGGKNGPVRIPRTSLMSMLNRCETSAPPSSRANGPKTRQLKTSHRRPVDLARWGLA